MKINSISFDHNQSVQKRNKGATDKALNYFDDFYKSVYGSQWGSIRNGLFASNKYIAVVNNYSDNEETKKYLESRGALSMRRLFILEKERIKKKKQADKRNSDLEIVFQLDRQLESQASATVQDTSLHTEEHSLNTTNTGSQYSLAEALKKAQIDSSRIITPDITDMTSALYEFVPATKIKGQEGFIPETQHYRYYEETVSFMPKIEKEYDLHFPEHLNVYCYETNNHSTFAQPKRGTTSVLNYYLLDGASLLPVLSLGLKPDSTFLDMCCAPGGKAYITLQTLYPKQVVCNDIDVSRIKRINTVLKQYFYDLEEKWFSTGRIKVIQEDARVLSWDGFDCVMVDVPCTNDRLSLHENDNNWFKSSRTKERLLLPEVQAAILSNALKLVRVGGTVVYSTCSLSPIQNDGVVNMALKQIWNETHIELVIKDLSPALAPFQCIFRFAEQNILRFGHLVVPHVAQNYGPMYFCKIQRIK